ncbi:MAG: AbrB/MazE/SpoVT family DNA-binding domain-containing protein [Candidatus Methanoperedens sp.]|jgi:AbrB family looped-hinge helix DNA binding protein|nr:AbrB/MazE/SpoVT family DNA-binding domain-containing protein [Candidatus Methanoperedens sp.]PKL54152.1 MAG: AbrB family transcriptional regulator [Candidatus Methanoperedenaceae archaeon HGW-Methanoperedenaceae-1]
MTTAKVTRSAQITIPKKIRDELGISEGDSVDVYLEDDKIIIRKGAPKMGEFHDFLPHGFDSVLEKIRGK